MKKLLSLLSVLTISGTSLPTIIAANNYYKKENQNKKTENEIINIDGKKHKKEKIEFNLYKEDINIINNIFFDEKNIPYVVVQIIKENKNINEVEVFNLLKKQKENDLNNIEEFVAKSNHNFKLKNNIFWKDDENIMEFIIFLKYNKNYIYFCDNKKNIFKYKIQENKIEKIYTNNNPD
jgi:MoaA/NifB/PqqE/SkfB family radical SAM enzyme